MVETRRFRTAQRAPRRADHLAFAEMVPCRGPCRRRLVVLLSEHHRGGDEVRHETFVHLQDAEPALDAFGGDGVGHVGPHDDLAGSWETWKTDFVQPHVEDFELAESDVQVGAALLLRGGSGVDGGSTIATVTGFVHL